MFCAEPLLTAECFREGSWCPINHNTEKSGTRCTSALLLLSVLDPITRPWHEFAQHQSIWGCTGWGQPSLKHSTVRFKPSSEYSIFTLLGLVGLRGTAWHKITRGRNMSNQSKANACENCRRGGFATHFCAWKGGKQARVAFPARIHLCFVGHHSVVSHEPPCHYWMALINQISNYHFKTQKRNKIKYFAWLSCWRGSFLSCKIFFAQISDSTKQKKKGKYSNCYKQKWGEKLVLSVKGLCFH